MQGTILLVEDEAAIAAFVQTALEREGFAVEVVEDGRQALARVNQALPDLIILDLMLPGVDGLEVCRAVRRMPSYVPIIMLTARTEDVDKVVGLELGADDYITKPFNTRELVARVRAVLRLAYSHATMEEPDRLRIGRLEIDLTGRTVTVGGQSVDLTPKEFGHRHELCAYQ
jgi:two-component system alkaline phosphatase synthesis response regulator PhoP